MVIAAVVIITLRDHRLLRRYTFTAMAAGLALLLLPLVPGLGRSVLRLADLDRPRPVHLPAR